MRLALLLLFVTVQMSYCQDIELPWKAEQQLRWSDFKASPDYNHPYAAITYSGMSYGFSAEVINGSVNVSYSVNSFFVANKSWVKPRYIRDAKLLKHEQLHFDITELFARKFRKRLSKMTFTENVKAEIKAVYKRITQEKTRFQELYDLETDHSKNEAKQREWQNAIALELQKHIEFASK